MTARLLVSLLGVFTFVFVGCDSADGGGDADVADADVVMDADVDMDGSVEEETVCDGGCWIARCRELTYASGAPTDPLDVGEMRDGSYVAYTDGGRATLVFGFQGGVMIEPTIRVPTEDVGAEDCAQVTVRNRPDPAYPDAHGELAEFTETLFIDPLRPNLPGFLSVTIADQLGWNSVAELRMILEVEARGVDWVRSSEFAVHVVDADGLDECDGLPRRSMFGCELAVLEGNITVDSVGETDGVACNETVDMTVTLTPDMAVPDGCVELTQTVSVRQPCVEREGYVAGADLGATTWELPLDPSSSSCGTPEAPVITSCPCP